MKVVFHPDFYQVYTTDPAAAAGRIEAIVNALPPHTQMITPEPATAAQLAQAHSAAHIDSICSQGLYGIASLAAGAAIATARIGLSEPAFGLLRPPGHHASSDSCWGFCFFNNMAVALTALKGEGLIQRALVLDIDLHYGDGTVNILGGQAWVDILNPESRTRDRYLEEVQRSLDAGDADLIAISAGFDHHVDDWGGLLETEDYANIGRMVHRAATAGSRGSFAILEGGYNHAVLGQNAVALMAGLEGV